MGDIIFIIRSVLSVTVEWNVYKDKPVSGLWIRCAFNQSRWTKRKTEWRFSFEPHLLPSRQSCWGPHDV